MTALKKVERIAMTRPKGDEPAHRRVEEQQVAEELRVSSEQWRMQAERQCETKEASRESQERERIA
jgi:hypothetical protein